MAIADQPGAASHAMHQVVISMASALGYSPCVLRQRSERGFTLLELLVTLVIVGLLAMLSLPYLSIGWGATGLTTDARLLASRFRAAREIALSTRTSTVVTVDLAKAVVHGPGDWSPYRFTAGKHVKATTAKGRVTGENVQFTFGPDGSSTGGVVMLQDGARTRSVKVEWLTGTVSISDVAQ